jgi:hypothetical protein
MVTQAGWFNREPCYRRRNQGNVIPSKRFLQREPAFRFWVAKRFQRCVLASLFVGFGS